MEHSASQPGTAVLSRPVKGRSGIVRWTEHQGGDVHPIATAYELQAALNRELANRHEMERLIKATRIELLSAQTRRDNLIRENRSLKEGLAAWLMPPQGEGWRGVICGRCGCLCKPRETCPMCTWNRYDKERSTE